MTDSLQVTIVGSSPAIPRAGRSCSAYLIRGAGASFVVDFGTGAFASLRRVMAPEALDAIVITHMHADHFIDLVPLRYALKYGVRSSAKKLPLYLPPGGEYMLRRLTGAFASEPAGDFLDAVYEVRTYDPTSPLALGSGTVRFAPTRHYIPTFAVRYDATGGSITYSSDTAPCEAVVDLARGTTLFICEATLEASTSAADPPGHCTAAEAGAMATAAGAESLVLSHWPAETTPERLRSEAAKVFARRIHVADDLDSFDLASAREEGSR